MTTTPTWLPALATLYLLISAACAVFAAIDVRRYPQPMAIMNVVWPITALYLGPVAIWSYLRLARADGASRPRAFWQQIVIEATHCGAGCSLGDVIAEFALFFSGIVVFGSRLLTRYAGDFVLAYAFGIVFQYLAIAPMRGLTFWPGLRAAIAADSVSLTAFEIGLFFSMWLMTLLPFHAQLTPLTPTYWFLMQMGMIVGFVTSYPANWWLVHVGIKTPM